MPRKSAAQIVREANELIKSNQALARNALEEKNKIKSQLEAADQLVGKLKDDIKKKDKKLEAQKTRLMEYALHKERLSGYLDHIMDLDRIERKVGEPPPAEAREEDMRGPALRQILTTTNRDTYQNFSNEGAYGRTVETEWWNE